ncbi:MAG: tRNA (adenosine(37)-N6)-threonylcarbamoyltransferase complex dimerization subunit type 1 TsaB, partial [Thermomicrobiales bacterium]|nr:tRNA (adenosine(37)-N6)-threonylcarbamoyltransferase complex dimerization subunit type 1 TsaB [Thermomicrobiales bacterium]
AATPGHILIIDTSTAQGSVALYDGEHLSTRTWPAARTHTTTLLGEIHHLLAGAGLASEDLAAVAVATGPGAFTALRVGMGVAKGFHLAADTPLIGISTLAATALPYAGLGQRVVATLPAGRGRLVWQPFTSDHNDVAPEAEPRNGTGEELLADLLALRESPVIIAGEFSPEHAKLLAAAPNATIPPAALRHRSPGAFAELAWRAWQAQDLADPSQLEPTYLSR